MAFSQQLPKPLLVIIIIIITINTNDKIIVSDICFVCFPVHCFRPTKIRRWISESNICPYYASYRAENDGLCLSRSDNVQLV